MIKSDDREHSGPALVTVEGAASAESAPDGSDAACAIANENAASSARKSRPYWQEPLAPYAQPRLLSSLLNLCTSVVPYLGISVAMWLALDRLAVPAGFVLLLSFPAAGFLVRTFIVFHDCTHGSFLASRRANAWLGTVLGLLVYAPFLRWRHDHAIHHATSGDLNRRGAGDVRTLTVSEYLSLDWKGRLSYRLFRNPLLMFGIGPIVSLLVGPRIVARDARPRMRRSVMWTNVALALIIGGLVFAIGWEDLLLVQGPTIMLAGAAGIWLFYVQHQFEDAYWEDSGSWSYADAALRGSST